MKALVIAEFEKSARELCAGARELAEEVVLLVLRSPAITEIADLCIRIDIPEDAVADDAYLSVIDVYEKQKPQIVLGETSTHVLSLIGRLASHIGTAAITDVSSIVDEVGSSMYFGGVGVKKSKAKGEVSIFTVGEGVFDGSRATGTSATEEAAFIVPAAPIVRIGTEEIAKSDVNLPGADVVIAAGRGFSEKDDLDLARALCAKAKGELGCTRPLTEGVDWMPREAYIGVSGLMLSPKTYIGIGISGQMQHMVGCNRAETVFAINKDKNAPIFKQCDYGIVGDLKEVLPALTAAL